MNRIKRTWCKIVGHRWDEFEAEYGVRYVCIRCRHEDPPRDYVRHYWFWHLRVRIRDKIQAIKRWHQRTRLKRPPDDDVPF
jgi:hypothetical protein